LSAPWALFLKPVSFTEDLPRRSGDGTYSRDPPLLPRPFRDHGLHRE
jgi:hypothetical protein